MIQVSEEEYCAIAEQAAIIDTESGADRELDYNGTDETTCYLLDEKYGEANWFPIF